MLCLVATGDFFLGRAASGGALAPEPPRATRSQPESIQTIIPFFFPELSQSKKKIRVEPAQLEKKKKKRAKNESGEKCGLSRLNSVFEINLDSAGSSRFFKKKMG